MASWPDEARAQLRAYAAEGLSARQIGEKMDRTRNAVIGEAYRLGIKLGGSAGRAQRLGAQAAMRAKRLERGPPRAAPPRKRTVRDLLAALPATEAGDSGHVPAKLVSFEDLEPHHCRYVHGDVHKGRWGYCGKSKVPGLSYCEFHARRCYRVPEADRPSMGALKLFHKVGA